MLEKNLKLVRPNMYKSVTTFSEETLKGSKATRAETIYTSTVTYNDMKFDADEKSMDRMTRYLTIASYDFNKALAEGTSSSDAYQAVYASSTINWILANNVVQTITLTDLVNIYKLCVDAMKNNWI